MPLLVPACSARDLGERQLELGDEAVLEQLRRSPRPELGLLEVGLGAGGDGFGGEHLALAA